MEPETSSAVLSSEDLAEAKQYARRKLQCTLLAMAIDLVVLFGFAIWAAGPIDDWLVSGNGVWTNRWLRLVAFFMVFSATQIAASVLLSWYSGYILEHQYGLSRQSLGRWVGRYLLQHLLGILFGVLLVVGLYAVIQVAGRWWWVLGALAVFAVTVVVGQLAPVLILPLFYKIERMQDSELIDRFRALAQGTGLRIEGIYRMRLSRETVKANAMLAGLGSTRRVILGDTLIDQFEPEEIEVVLAHEIGHHVHRHIAKMVAIGFVASVGTFLVVDLVLRWRFAPQPVDYAELPVHCLPLILLVVTVCSTVLGPIQNYVSRYFERQCDQYALDHTESRHDYRSAFTKLAKLNKTDPDPDPWEVALFHDHPPIVERLAMADASRP